MIQANELRIGNWVQHHDKIIQVDIIDLDYTYQLNPIPLTPEILKNIGEPKGDSWIYLPNNFRVCCTEVTGLCNLSMGMTETGNDEIDWFIISCPEYLHQLQNIIHSLTGTELKINL